jgi:glycosyltransferase involved in cell wall biosynthesis
VQRVLKFPRVTPPLRLVFVTGSLPDGGAERQTMALLGALAQRGHDCHAFCVKPLRAPLTSAMREAQPHSLNAASYLDFKAVAEFATRLAHLKPQAVIAANGYALLYATLAVRRARLDCRVVVTWHSTRAVSFKESLQMLAYRPLCWLADCTVFLCRRQQRHWLRRGLWSRRHVVIHNGIDAENFRDRSNVPQRLELRRQLGWRAADYVIGIPALLRVEKNHLQLLEAVARLRRAGIPARALLIGDGELRATIERRMGLPDLEGAVHITGMQQDVRPWLASCDVVTLCSVTETFSLAALEGMAMGKPVVLSDVGGAAEMVEPGWNGLLFPPRDTDAYVECLATLSDMEAARRMGANARRLVELRFAAATMVDRYEDLLAGLCHRSSRATAPLPSADQQAARESG